MLAKKRFSVGYWVAVLFVACFPVVLLSIFSFRQANLRDFKFSSNDEIGYYHQILTFKDAGFNGGYYTLFEEPAIATFTHFYTYGPWFPLVYGVLARFTGWELYSFLIINALVVITSIVGFCYITRPDKWQLLLIGLGLITSYSFMLFLFTGFQEAFQQSLAIGMAAILAIAFQKRENTTLRVRIISILFIVFAGLNRVSWCLLLLPYLLLVSRKRIRGFIFAVILAVLISYGIYWIWGKVGAPGYNMVTEALTGFVFSLRRGVTKLLERASQNIQWFLNPQEEYTPAEKSLYLLQNMQMIGLVLISLIGAGIVWFRRQHFDTAIDWLFHAYNLSTIIVLTLLLYITRYRGDYRVFAPHIMITVLLLIYRKRYRIALLFIGTSLIFFPAYLQSQSRSTSAHFDPVVREAYEDFRQTAHSLIQYDPQAPNGWCNTLYFYVENYVTEIAGTPGGIGLSFYFKGNLKAAYLRSQYLLLSDKDYADVQQRVPPPNLVKLGITKLGTLYRNNHSACGQEK